MNLAELKSEAHIYSLQSAAGANTTAHQFKQELINEQRMSLTEMKSEMKLEKASILRYLHTNVLQKSFVQRLRPARKLLPYVQSCRQNLLSLSLAQRVMLN